MENYRIGIVPGNKQKIHEIETLRKEVFHLKPTVPDRYMKPILDEIIIPFALYDQDQLIGGCYVGEAYGSLYIYYLFIKEEYQKTGLKLGRKLLQDIIDHREDVEALLETSFKKTALHPLSEGVKKVYYSIGYHDAPKGIMIREF